MISCSSSSIMADTILDMFSFTTRVLQLTQTCYACTSNTISLGFYLLSTLMYPVTESSGLILYLADGKRFSVLLQPLPLPEVLWPPLKCGVSILDVLPVPEYWLWLSEMILWLQTVVKMVLTLLNSLSPWDLSPRIDRVLLVPFYCIVDVALDAPVCVVRDIVFCNQWSFMIARRRSRDLSHVLCSICQTISK